MNEAMQPATTDWIIAISALASAAILLFYTIYTRRMQQAVNKQAEELVYQRRLGIMPAILIKLDDRNLELTNIGNGTAINIGFNIIRKETDSELDYKGLERYEIKTSILRPNESFNKKLDTSDFDRAIDESKYGVRIFGEVTFNDIQGNVYKEVLEDIGNWLRYGFPVIVKVDTILSEKEFAGKSATFTKIS